MGSTTSAPTTSPESGPPDGPATRERGIQTFRSLRHRDYRILWGGIVTSSVGQWMEQLTLGWLALTITDSAFWVGAVSGARAIPFLVLSPFAGAMADRVDRKMLLAGSQLATGVVAATMAVLNLTGQPHIGTVMGLSLALGAAWAVNNPSRQTLVPQLVPRESLMNAIALNSVGFNISRTLGPFLSGVLLRFIDVGGVFVITSSMYVLVFASTLAMRVPARRPQEGPRESIWRNIAEGGRYLRQHPMLRSMVLFSFIPVGLGMPYMSLMPVFARDVLGREEFGLGLMLAAAGIGAVTGSVILATAGALRRPARVMLVMGTAFGCFLVGFGLSHQFPLSLGILMLTGASLMAFNTISSTVIQTNVDDAFRGRVMSVLMMEFGFTPLFTFFGGVVAQAFSPEAAVMTMGIAVVVGMISAYALMPGLKYAEMSPPRPPAEPGRRG
ncbi:MAG: MFS transporter [Dehalococcoidia bacterium]|nr:MFS transporter [Dehalococcoidia bacterium]